MLLRFTKMHGFGNDLMVLDLISQYAYIQPQQMRVWSERRTGVGFERLALIEVPQHPDVDFSCRVFDTNGAEVDWLASDLWCVARLVADKRLISKAQMRIELRHAVIDVEVHADGSVSVPLAAASVLAETIALPRSYTEPSAWLRATDVNLVLLHGLHAVLAVADVVQAPMAELAEHVAQQVQASDNTLITALQVQDMQTLSLRTWQLGRGDIEHFHHGVCAAALYAIEQGWVNSQVQIQSSEGGIECRLHRVAQQVWITGLATRIYEGQIRI